MTESAPTSEPAEEPVEMSAIDAAAADIGWPEFDAENDAREQLQRLSVPASTLGRLAELAVWLSGTQATFPPSEPERARVVVFAAEHGVAQLGVTAPSAISTADRVAALQEGSGLANTFAGIAGAGVRVVDTGVGTVGDPAQHWASGRADQGRALTTEQVERAVSTGHRIADEEIDGGADLLIAANTGSGADIVAAAVVSIMTNTDPVKVLGFGATLDDATWMRAACAVRDARRYGLDDRYDVTALLGRVGGTDIAALTGFLLRAAARRTPVLLDGGVVCAAALLAREVSPRVIRWWQAAHRTSARSHTIALEALQLEPLLELQLGLDEGVGALLAVPLLHAAVRAVTQLALPAGTGVD